MAQVFEFDITVNGKSERVRGVSTVVGLLRVLPDFADVEMSADFGSAGLFIHGNPQECLSLIRKGQDFGYLPRQ